MADLAIRMTILLRFKADSILGFWPVGRTLSISGGAKRRPLHAVVGRHVAHAILRRHE
jgi:hypothetical protein